MKSFIIIIFSFFIISTVVFASHREAKSRFTHKIPKPETSLQFDDKFAMSLNDNPYYSQKAPSISLNLGFRF